MKIVFFAEADLYILNLFFHLLSMQIDDCFPSIAGWLVSGYSISFDKFLIVCNVLGAVYKLNRVCRESTRPQKCLFQILTRVSNILTRA